MATAEAESPIEAARAAGWTEDYIADHVDGVR
jgi:hypothetical protein